MCGSYCGMLCVAVLSWQYCEVCGSVKVQCVVWYVAVVCGNTVVCINQCCMVAMVCAVWCEDGLCSV